MRGRNGTMTTSDIGDDRDRDSTGDDRPTGLRRRAVLKRLAALGVGSLPFRRALAMQAAQSARVTPEMVKQAEWIAGIDFSDEERTGIARSLDQSLRSFEALRKVDVGYDVAPALTFFPTPPRPAAEVRRNQARPIDGHTPARPGSDEELAFLPVTELSKLIRTRKVSSMELTHLYLDRLKRFDPLLKCVVTLTEDLASGRRSGPTRRSPPADIGGRCTASPGGPRT